MIWKPGEPWRWPGAEPPVEVGQATLVRVEWHGSWGSSSAHFTRADGKAMRMRLSRWRAGAERGDEPHGRPE